ncbi:hypothetical protein FB451DRAFT_958239, partial [Mycena latifolia]
LPPEITSEIFIYCLPTSQMARERNTVNPHEAPMLLSHVCRAWREIALGTPALWTTMELEIMAMRDLQWKTEISKMWLDRAGALAL